MKTTDTQALFVSGSAGLETSGSDYVGAYRSGNKFYNNGLTTTPTFHQDTVQRSNIYDFIRTGD